MSPAFPSGHLIAGRYRLGELLGVGRTVEVYRAEDTSLHRTVALKVLLSSLAEHEEVRRAFRDHIIRSATLSHPHLAQVYDGGQESGAIFMVTEYLPGRSLEDLLNDGRRFSVDEAARLGRDVASALAYAHANGFVHGALSPTKLLFDAEGHVRVSGTALSGLSRARRERLSVDEVRYFSPEQAVGDEPDSHSDVYALALILFEAVTGTVAFEGATTESVLQARLSSPLPVRAELGTLDMILAQATVPDVRLRLNAEQFSNRLGAVAPDTLDFQVGAPRSAAPLLARFTPNEPRNSIGFRPPSPDQIVSSSTQRPRPVPPMEATRGIGAPVSDPREVARSRRSRRAGIGALAVVLVVLIVGLVAGAAWRLGLFSTTHTVPELVGLNYHQAASALQGDGYTLSVTGKVHSAHIPTNSIVTQVPSAGTVAKSGSTITVTVSSGPVLVTLPTTLVGEDCVSATAALIKIHVNATCPSTEAIYSNNIASGKVVRILYHKTVNPIAVPIRSTVLLSLSKGPNPATTTTAPTTTTTAPASTTTAPTTTTTARSSTPGRRAVPNVVGMDQAQVYAAFKKAQLYFTTHGPGAGTTKWTKVLSEVPSAGTLVAWHSSVSLNVN